MAGESKQPFVSLHTGIHLLLALSLPPSLLCNFFHSVPQLHVTERLGDGNRSNASPTCKNKEV